MCGSIGTLVQGVKDICPVSSLGLLLHRGADGLRHGPSLWGRRAGSKAHSARRDWVTGGGQEPADGPLSQECEVSLIKGLFTKVQGNHRGECRSWGSDSGSSPFSGLKREETCALGRNAASQGTPHSPPALQSPVSHWPNPEKCSPCGSVSPGQGAGSRRMTGSGGRNGD